MHSVWIVMELNQNRQQVFTRVMFHQLAVVLAKYALLKMVKTKLFKIGSNQKPKDRVSQKWASWTTDQESFWSQTCLVHMGLNPISVRTLSG